MTLFIDTAEYKSISFTLKGAKKTFQKTYTINPQESFKTLGKLEVFLKSTKVKTSEIKKIIVNTGPGSFSGVRTGVSHALAISLAWGIPVLPLENIKFHSKLDQKSALE